MFKAKNNKAQDNKASKIEEIKTGTKYVAASTEPVDKADVVDYVEEMINCGADFIHCDVMDGIAVPKETYNEKVVGLLRRKFPKAKLDVHLMTAGGSETVKKYIRFKPYAITVQYDYFDTEKDLTKALREIKAAGIKAGLSFSPNVPLAYIAPYLSFIDLVLIMGVRPGLGGQQLIPATLTKVKEVKALKEAIKRSLIISFDGGVNMQNASDIFNSGADMVVSGSAIYNAFDREYAIKALKSDGVPLVY